MSALLLPLMAGVKVVCHPTPLQPREIVRRIREHGATILLSTDTFITQYARAGEADDLDILRLAVCGAERVRDETRALFRRKYDMDILEGYGVTEASPVVAANQIEANRPGTVGRLMAGMEARLEPVEGIADAGDCCRCSGPNVMLGYIKPDAPGVIVPPRGRLARHRRCGERSTRTASSPFAAALKRFAKIGGETVSLAVVENCAAALWPDNAPCRRRRCPMAARASRSCWSPTRRRQPHGPARLGAKSRRLRTGGAAPGADGGNHSGAGHRQDRLCRRAKNGRSGLRRRDLISYCAGGGGAALCGVR